MLADRKIVYKIEEGINPKDVYCTTYQMRNFFKQLSDGFFSSLDIMNYIQHHKAVLMMKRGYRILDVCCGRGLLLPLIRWYRKDISEYVGIDISEQNINEQKRWSGTKKLECSLDEYYPFKITHILGSVEDMDDFFDSNSFDMIIYTSAIEHMQKEIGEKSLENCFKILKEDHLLFLSCPNTPHKKDPYDTQYAAHLYEWDLQELTVVLQQIGFAISDVYGLVAKVREFEEFISKRPDEEQRLYGRFKSYFPTQWLMAIVPILYPEISSEVLILVTKQNQLRKRRFFNIG